MKTTQQLDDLGENRWLGNITGRLGGSQTHGLFIDDLAVTVRATAMQIGRQEK